MDANDNITPTAFEEAEYAANTGYIGISTFRKWFKPNQVQK